MLESELPLAARFIIAFLIVIALIGITAWAMRRFGGPKLGQTARGRQPRLAVLDATPVDGRRQLVLVRRDNFEHLLLIGGPSDVVVETNIVRAAPVAAGNFRDPVNAETRRQPGDDLPLDLQAEQSPFAKINSRQVASAQAAFPAQIKPTLNSPASRPRPATLEEQAPANVVRMQRAAPQPIAERGYTNQDNEDVTLKLEAALLMQEQPIPQPQTLTPLYQQPQQQHYIPQAQPVPAPQPAAAVAPTLLRPTIPPTPIEPVATAPVVAIQPTPLERLAAVTPPQPQQQQPSSLENELLRSIMTPAPQQQSFAAPEPVAQPQPKTVFDNLEEEMANLLGRGVAKG